MPQGKSAAGVKFYGQVKVEHYGKLVYQSPPEYVKVSSLLHQLYEARRAKYCFLSRGVEIPYHYRTGDRPPRYIGVELVILDIKIRLRRLKKWLKEHHPLTSSM
jgi:hypothetical protein